jgi:hypothetical protein
MPDNPQQTDAEDDRGDQGQSDELRLEVVEVVLPGGQPPRGGRLEPE